jgi:DNA-binding transcriptional regulator YiaG
MPRRSSRKAGRRNAPAPQLDELDEEALLDELRRFVKNCRLSKPRIALLMGVSVGSLNGWIEGTIEPRKAKLLDIESFLKSHAPAYLRRETGDRC